MHVTGISDYCPRLVSSYSIEGGSRLKRQHRKYGVDLRLSSKINNDVQGYEDRVFRGGERTIRTSKLVVVEMSFALLYEGQPLFQDIYGLLSNWGFRYAGSLYQTLNPHDGSVLQSDAIFLSTRNE